MTSVTGQTVFRSVLRQPSRGRNTRPIRRRRWARVLPLALVLFLAVEPLALARGGKRPDAATVLAGLQGWLDGTRDLQAAFEQELVSGAFGAGMRESGRLWLRRPGQMRWEYQEPERKTAIVDDVRTTLYLAEEGQVMLGRLDSAGQLLPTLLAGEGRLEALFDVTLEPSEQRGRLRLRLTPRATGAAGAQDDAGEGVESVVVVTRRPDYAIEAAEVLDSTGNRMRYRFSALRRNRGVSADRFVLETGPEVEVVGSHDPVAAGPPSS